MRKTKKKIGKVEKTLNDSLIWSDIKVLINGKEVGKIKKIQLNGHN